MPRAFALYQSQPNPFRNEVAIRFDLPVEARVKLTIHDIQGRLIRVLADRRAPAGQHSLLWDRRTDAGRAVAPGVYLYRLEAGTYRARKKMVALP